MESFPKITQLKKEEIMPNFIQSLKKRKFWETLSRPTFQH